VLLNWKPRSLRGSSEDRLYFDEDSMDRALVRALRVRDIIVTTALDAGRVGRPDIEHLAHASSTGQALFTYNVGDFMLCMIPS
jgi:hypothetical protein